jgi:hypothetical protein
MPPVIKPFRSHNCYDQRDPDEIVTNISIRAYEVVYSVGGHRDRDPSMLSPVPACWLDPRFGREVMLWALTRTEATSLMHLTAARMTIEGNGNNLRLAVRGRWVQYTDLSPEFKERIREQSRARRHVREAAADGPMQAAWMH